jgi:hypothetical protein
MAIRVGMMTKMNLWTRRSDRIATAIAITKAAAHGGVDNKFA